MAPERGLLDTDLRMSEPIQSESVAGTTGRPGCSPDCSAPQDPNPVLRVAADGRLLFANPGAAPLLSACGCKVGEAIPEQWTRFVADALASGKTVAEEVCCETTWYSLAFVPIPDMGQVSIYGRDVTESRRATAALERSQREFRAVIDLAPDGITIRSGGRLVYVNPVFSSYLGCTPQDLLGTDLLRLVRPRDRERVTHQWHGNDADNTFQMEVIGRDGEPRTLECSPSQRLEFEGQAAYLNLFRDVTQRTKLQAHLLVSERMASVGMLAAGVAHEINNPLAAAILNLEMTATLVDTLRQNPADVERQLAECADMLADALEATARVRQIVHDLRLFSRGDEDRRTSVALHPMLDSTLRMAWNEIRHRARLVKDYGIGVERVAGSEARLGQVFLNLVVNAAQAIPEGRAERNEIRVSTRISEDSMIAIEVRDSGSGIPTAVRDKLFSPFFTTKPIGEGTGLGLSICHRIVSGLGGRIEVESEVGRGSVFRVKLPVAQYERGSSAPPAGSVRRQAVRGRVLVIDDEVSIGRSIQRLLRDQHDVVAVSSALEAIARLRAGERYDVILCDLMMPEMTGMQFHAELATVAPNLVDGIVFITGGAFTSSATSFLDEVPNACLEKPIDQRALRALIDARLPI